MIEISSKATKGSVTDEKIKQIILDLYTINTYYRKIYQSVSDFFRIQSKQYAETVYTKNAIHDIWYDLPENTISEKWVMKNGMDCWSIKNSLYMLVGFLQGRKEEAEFIRDINKIGFKAVDIQEKYNISNVTIKSRLAKYFDMRVVHQWKIWHLTLFLNYETMLLIAISDFIEKSYGSFPARVIEFYNTFSKLWD